MNEKINYTDEFKFKVAIEAISGKKISQLEQEHNVTSYLIFKWKKQILESGVCLFQCIKSKEINLYDSDIEIKKLIGNRRARIIGLNKTSHHKNLSEKEELILYLIIFGKFDKEIAEILSKIYDYKISREAITKCVKRRLYAEFGVINRSELIIASYANGAWNHVPKLLIQYNNFL